ncbi:hypothetical protein SNE35_28270 [Paucibacter sp. R3-3]|uniref:Zinc ribbon domain-containing protein n=1 Tax=Roseateles agri TaxID=3098619 RepID=A0ABU5DRR1_9BURK|nr:hypothetical protein [Paucibacter sp. R3-3]MDY0748428.1 hypothetical protein [Paucibacter sp. R3-3]
MAKTLRSQNKCNDCRYTWYPRGKNLSRVCPSCGSENVAIVVNWTPIITAAAIVLYLVFGNKGSNAPATDGQPAAPIEVSAPTASKPQDGIAPEPLPAPVKQRTEKKDEGIELSAPASSTEQDAIPAWVVEPARAPSTPIEPAAAASQPAAKAGEFERVYSDEEIAALEDQKQYHGSDPIVRSRLGLPSRETHKLAR